MLCRPEVLEELRAGQTREGTTVVEEEGILVSGNPPVS